MSSWTGFGKSRKSRFEDPTQCSGFSPQAGIRRTRSIFHFWNTGASPNVAINRQPRPGDVERSAGRHLLVRELAAWVM